MTTQFRELVFRAVLWGCLSAPLYGGAPDAVESMIRAEAGPPIWVAADVAVDPRGLLRKELLGQHAESIERGARLDVAPAVSSQSPTEAQKVDECRSFIGSIPGHFAPTGSLPDLYRHASFVVSGTARSMREGFLQGSPGMLISLSAEYLKGEPSGETLLFYPLARIRTARGMICAKPVAEFHPPGIGDRFVVFSMVPPLVIGDRTILVVNVAREVVHEPRERAAILPAALRGQYQTLDVTVSAVRDLARSHNRVH